MATPSPLQPLSSQRLNALSSSSPSKPGTESTTDSSHSHPSPTRKQFLPQSPSLPDYAELQRRAHVRTNSDVHVQGLVKRFEHLDVRDRDAEYSERRKKDEAKLRRAEIAREEAEGDVRKFREECRALRRECEDAKERERTQKRRVDAATDDLHREKDEHAAQAALYDKELRKSRKEAFKSSSTVVKLQEELKSTRSVLRNTQQTLDLEKQKVQRREQDTFDAQYQLISVQEDLEKLRMQMKIVQEEKEALKSSLQQEEVARIAAEGRIALPAGDDEFSSPRKTRLSPAHMDENKENVPSAPSSPTKRTRLAFESQDLKEQLAQEKTWRRRADELAEFLQLECRFRCCTCHRERKRSKSPHHAEPALEPNGSAYAGESIREAMEIEQPGPIEPTPATPIEEFRQSKTITTTIPVHFDTPKRAGAQPLHEDMPPRPLSVGSKPLHSHNAYYAVHTQTEQGSTVTAAAEGSAMDDGNTVSADPQSTKFDRAAALAAIEYRRGRAKSIAQGTATPSKALMAGVHRRDITR